MLVDVNKLVVNDRTIRDDGSVEEYMKSIASGRRQMPLFVDENYVLLGGRRKLDAYKLLGYKDVEVAVLGFDLEKVGQDDSLFDDSHITRAQWQNMRREVSARVDYLISIFDEDRRREYRSSFMRRCYLDAKRESSMGTSYRTTLSENYADVLNYIQLWMPREGVCAYAWHLDDLRKKRA